MSEYQYYEFQAIDRPLTEKEQASIASLSRRVELTPTRAVFTYSFSDFPADANSILLKYFDAMLYLANWGTRQLAFRFPRSVVDAAMLKPYCLEDSITVRITKHYVLLDIMENREDGGSWVEGEGWLPVLAMLRQDVMRGDLRLLYLAWLKAVSLELAYEDEDTEDEDLENIKQQLEPPVPGGLQSLTQPLKKFVEFFDMDEDWIAAASQASPSAAVMEQDIESMIGQLPDRERNAFLVKVAKGEPNVEGQLMKRLYELSAGTRKVPVAMPRRTVTDLLTAANEQARQRKERQRQKAEREKMKRLQALSKKEPQVWKEVQALLDERKAKAYEEATRLLVQLKELADYTGARGSFAGRLSELCENSRNRPAFLARLKGAKLIR